MLEGKTGAACTLGDFVLLVVHWFEARFTRACMCVYTVVFLLSVASGTWTFSPCPPTLPRTSYLRRAQTTFPRRSPRGELLPFCPRPRSSPCSSTLLTEPTAGIRYKHKSIPPAARVLFSLLRSGPPRRGTHLIPALILIKFFTPGCRHGLLPLCVCGDNEPDLSIGYVSAQEMSPDPEVCLLSLFD